MVGVAGRGEVLSRLSNHCTIISLSDCFLSFFSFSFFFFFFLVLFLMLTASQVVEMSVNFANKSLVTRHSSNT